MKKHLISIVAVIVVLAVVLVSFGQEQRTRRPRMGREERVKAIEVIEAQLAKLKEGRKSQIQRADDEGLPGAAENISDNHGTACRHSGPKRARSGRRAIHDNHHCRPQANPGSRNQRESRGNGQASCQAGRQRQRIWRPKARPGRRKASRGPAGRPTVIAVNKIRLAKAPVVTLKRLGEKLAL